MWVLRYVGRFGRGRPARRGASASFVRALGALLFAILINCSPPEEDQAEASSVACASLGGAASIDFARDVQPILATYCMGCHGADEYARVADLRLDTREGIFSTRAQGRPPAVVPGDPDSLLLQRIKATDSSAMPPPITKQSLSAREVAVLECWVTSGARYPDSWILSVPVRPAVPAVADAGFVRNPIDAFVLAELEALGLAPAPPAPPHQQLRRLSLVLRGLPPSLDEVTAFEADSSEAAYLALVDKMLAEPSFGEHRAHYWLDAARYADTSGYSPDAYRSIWPYRDYVINSFNQNKPFDRFTIEQLAGDLLPDANVETQMATGFLRNSMSIGESGVVPEEYRVRYANDRVHTLSSIWLGLTTTCAACHDHKFDPISQKEFYALTAYFNNTTQPDIDPLPPEQAPPTIVVPPSMTPTLVSVEAKAAPAAYVLDRGRYDAPLERVVAGVPQVLPPLPDGAPNNRLGLAQWLMSPDHPLTARVTVNRFWAEVFGVGLVATAHDFGKAGEAPTHPELLDWLAVEFRESGWDVKHLFRLMVTSSSYRQSAVATLDKLTLDPDNRMLSRGPRFRMDGETIRDLALAASGLLVQRVGGPSVKPYQPPGLWEEVSQPLYPDYHYQQDTGEGLYRRSVYTYWKRTSPPPSLSIFNAPSREQSVVQRERSNTPLQALVTLNDVQFVEAARNLAVRALALATTTDERLHWISRLVLARPLREDELVLMTAALDALSAKYQAEPALATSLLQVGESPKPARANEPELAAWTMIASSFLNLDEALHQ